MGPLQRGTAASACAAAIGVALWTVLSYATGWGLGVVAVPIGVLTGVAMAQASGRRVGIPAGLVAATIALAAMLGGRYAWVCMELGDLREEAAAVDADEAIDTMAWEVYDSDPSKWNLEESDGDLPPELRARAERVWDVMTADQQEETIANIAARRGEEFDAASPVLGAVGMVASIGIGGLCFMVGGVVAALRLGSAVNAAEAAIVEHAGDDRSAGEESAGMAVLRPLPGLPPLSEPVAAPPVRRRAA